jgi:AraC family transcriptional regulator
MESWEKLRAVQRMQDFIEGHINEKITLLELARAGGYSPWHAARIFKEFTGKPPFDYIRSRRLSCAALKISSEKVKVIDVAFDFVFDSHEGFTRAFTRQFGLAPHYYSKNSARPVKLFLPGRVQDSYYRSLQTGDGNIQRGEEKKRKGEDKTQQSNDTSQKGEKNICKADDNIQKIDSKLQKGENSMLKKTKTNTVFVQVVDRPQRKLILKRGIKATYYFEYCEEIGCDVWDVLSGIKEALFEPIGMWLPDGLIEAGTSVYAQGVEVPYDYSGIVPEGFDLINLPSCKMMVFQGQPYKDEKFEKAISDLWEVMKSYDPHMYGFEWADEDAPRFQLEPLGYRGYIEARPVRPLP